MLREKMSDEQRKKDNQVFLQQFAKKGDEPKKKVISIFDGNLRNKLGLQVKFFVQILLTDLQIETSWDLLTPQLGTFENLERYHCLASALCNHS